jgi:S-adenosylmethionine:tRNA ribosyltransferase-isomerase
VELAEFDYPLPASAIAQAPAERRDGSRLLRIDRERHALTDHGFADLPDLLRAGDCLVVNDSRVLPARVLARDPVGRPVELLFVEPAPGDPRGDRPWQALVRPGRRCRPGVELRAGDGAVRFRIASVEPDGTRLVECLDGGVLDALERHGLPPLPPYIAHHAKPGSDDAERYQTVYARSAGSIAAPTAGLHFTPELLDRLRARGVEVHALTLHVGAATFRPIKVARVEDHALPAERVVISETAAHAVNAARREGRRVVAVGTTTTRALESAVGPDGLVRATTGRADVFIVPGHRFRVVDALLTNFHLPRSSLLVLVSAFAGRALVLDAYRHALAAGYRFYSYGDATLIV